MEIPAELEAKIDEAITHYPVFKRSATLPLLHLFQEHFGYITDEAIDWIAKKLELTPINVLELVNIISASAELFPARWLADTSFWTLFANTPRLTARTTDTVIS